ncbi:uncharacterized protein G2W53_026246 [Senna tora]|uniref:Uncharacterized protein n=1 Tax=Senna tora TaxID=362788 RepID=A0A834WIM4_9FABA|nr:uncharacterized protein G2W53_026246 [Senna tora]
MTAISRSEYVKTRSTLLLSHHDSNWKIKSTQVSDIRPQFVIQKMLRHDPRSSHAMTTPYVKTCSTLLPCYVDSNSNIKSTPVCKCNAKRRVSLTCATSLLPQNS